MSCLHWVESRDGFERIEVTDLRRAWSEEGGWFWDGNGDGGCGAAEVTQVRGRAIGQKIGVGFGRRVILKSIDWCKHEMGSFKGLEGIERWTWRRRRGCHGCWEEVKGPRRLKNESGKRSSNEVCCATRVWVRARGSPIPPPHKNKKTKTKEIKKFKIKK